MVLDFFKWKNLQSDQNMNSWFINPINSSKQYRRWSENNKKIYISQPYYKCNKKIAQDCFSDLYLVFINRDIHTKNRNNRCMDQQVISFANSPINSSKQYQRWSKNNKIFYISQPYYKCNKKITQDCFSDLYIVYINRDIHI